MRVICVGANERVSVMKILGNEVRVVMEVMCVLECVGK